MFSSQDTPLHLSVSTVGIIGTQVQKGNSGSLVQTAARQPCSRQGYTRKTSSLVAEEKKRKRNPHSIQHMKGEPKKKKKNYKKYDK